jgi:ribosomal-protein-alanine N-acetyltransferase
MELNFPDTLECEGIHLRALHMDDAEVFFSEYTRDPEVARFLRWRPHRSAEETMAFIQERVSMRDLGHGCYWALTLKDDGPIGLIGVRVEERGVNIGFGLSRQFWGKGYMRSAVRSVLNWAWQQHAIEHVSASCDVENQRSMDVLDKAGFQRTGIKRSIRPNLSDEPRDSYCYVITKPK